MQRAAIIKHVKTLMRCSGRVIKYAGVEYAALKFVVVSQVLSSSKGTWRSGEGPTGLNWKLDINLCLFAKCYFFFTLRGKWKVLPAVSNEENNTNKTLMGSLFL